METAPPPSQLLLINLTTGTEHCVETRRINGKNKTFSIQPGDGSLKGPPQPPTLRWYWVLRQQTQTANGDTCKPGDIRKHRLMETQLLRRSRWAFEGCLLSFPCQYPFSSAGGSSDSLTSLFHLAWSQILERCDYPSPLAPLCFEEEFWKHLSPYQLCFPLVQWPL